MTPELLDQAKTHATTAVINRLARMAEESADPEESIQAAQLEKLYLFLLEELAEKIDEKGLIIREEDLEE